MLPQLELMEFSSTQTLMLLVAGRLLMDLRLTIILLSFVAVAWSSLGSSENSYFFSANFLFRNEEKLLSIGISSVVTSNTSNTALLDDNDSSFENMASLS